MPNNILIDEITFQKVNQTHHESIASLFNYYILNSTAIAFYDEMKTPEIMSYFDIDNPSTYAFCINHNSAFCGFCLLKNYNSAKPGCKYTFEITIYLDKDFTRKGIGPRAIGYLEEIATANGIKTIVAGICSENLASIRIFERKNFLKCGHLKNMVIKFDRIFDTIYYQKLLG